MQGLISPSHRDGTKDQHNPDVSCAEFFEEHRPLLSKLVRAAEDFQGLFYALLMKKRVELGVSPFPTGPATELPAHTHEPYEDAIRAAGREVGRLLIERKELPFVGFCPVHRRRGRVDPIGPSERQRDG